MLLIILTPLTPLTPTPLTLLRPSAPSWLQTFTELDWTSTNTIKLPSLFKLSSLFKLRPSLPPALASLLTKPKPQSFRQLEGRRFCWTVWMKDKGCLSSILVGLCWTQNIHPSQTENILSITILQQDPTGKDRPDSCMSQPLSRGLSCWNFAQYSSALNKQSKKQMEIAAICFCNLINLYNTKLLAILNWGLAQLHLLLKELEKLVASSSLQAARIVFEIRFLPLVGRKQDVSVPGAKTLLAVDSTTSSSCRCWASEMLSSASKGKGCLGSPPKRWILSTWA